MSDNGHEQFLRMAIEESRRAEADGNIAVGAVIVRAGEIVGAGQNVVNSQRDLTGHAEVSAIRDAGGRLGTIELTGSTLYTTMEPCPMCLWAICIAGIERLVLGARHAAFHRPEFGDYCVERMLEMTAAPLDLVTGVLESECEGLRLEMPRRP